MAGLDARDALNMSEHVFMWYWKKESWHVAGCEDWCESARVVAVKSKNNVVPALIDARQLRRHPVPSPGRPSYTRAPKGRLGIYTISWVPLLLLLGIAYVLCKLPGSRLFA